MHTFRIKNFQSIKDTSFTVEGFTVLVGENDIGKSSCFRSIHALFNSRFGDAFIKQGETFSEVSCSVKGSTITWKKPKKSGATYTLTKDGATSEFVNLGRSVPDFIGDMGYGELKLKSDSVDPHFSKQREEPFLVSSAGSKKVLTEFFSEMLKFGPLAVGSAKASKDLRDLNTDISVAEKQRQSVLDYLEGFPDVDELEQEYEILSHIVDQLDVEEKKIALLEAYSSCPCVPSIELSDLDETIPKSLSDIRKAYLLITQLMAIPSELSVPEDPKLDYIDELNLCVKKIKLLDQLIQSPSDLNLEFSPIDESMLKALSLMVDLYGLDIPYAPLEDPEYLPLLVELDFLILSSDILKLESALCDLVDQVRVLEKKISSGLEELGECPLCGAHHGK